MPSTSYLDGRGRPNVVRYWAMRPVDGEASPRAEVDDVAWLPADEARRVLTWQGDRAVLDAL